MTKADTLATNKSGNDKEKRKLSMSSIVLLSFAIGIIFGLFFGEYLAWMSIIGDAFIKLLQMTIIPYIIVSLISSLGRLSHQQARALGVHVGKLMLMIWLGGILLIYLIKFTFPQWQAGDFFSLAVLSSPETVDLLDLYIPSNPFFSLSNSYIPAIVLFCVATGVALISIKDKEALLTPMDLLGQAFNRVTQYIVKFMPIGIFCMTAATAGTMDLAEFQKLQVYFVAHIVMTIVLTYWLLPALIASITPFSHRDIAGIAKDAMITAFAAGNIFIILPILTERTKELFQKYELSDEKIESYPNIIIPVVFSFPNLGKLLALVFILFSAWFVGTDISFTDYFPMAVNGLISLFGSMYLTIPMLLDSLELPTDLFQLYMVSSLFTSRFTSLLAAMNIFVLAVGGAAMMAGIAKISMRRLITYAALTPVVVGITLLATSALFNSVISTDYQMDKVVKQMSTAVDLPENVKTYYFDELADPIPSRSVESIKQSGVLRVGYNPLQIPFSFFNSEDELVGYDVELMKKLASDLGVKIAFIPYKKDTALQAINQGQFDIAISGLQMTAARIFHANYTRPVLNLHYSLVVKDHRADEFDDLVSLKNGPAMTFAAVGQYSIMSKLQQEFPNVTVEEIESDQTFFNDTTNRWDGLIISLEAGKAWTILYPQYTTLFNKKELKSFPAAYAVSKDNTDLLNFLNSWLTIVQSSGYTDKLYSYWILGENAAPKKARWSVIKDVLGWVEQ